MVSQITGREQSRRLALYCVSLLGRTHANSYGVLPEVSERWAQYESSLLLKIEVLPSPAFSYRLGPVERAAPHPKHMRQRKFS